MSDKHFNKITYTFVQQYKGWNGTVFDKLTSRCQTFDILEKLDLLEIEVYNDRNYTLARGMLNDIASET